ncbi:unnamed protein product [Rotaria sp. Silwood2]|nr:unnamed protein product [Rotaria sp. Silwood2]CAF3474768.1 unnamed protein product [Rotaria sp. Silwood2]CAF4651629.1 unnamed protein product [Rotaria sp. Silwood2]
MYQTIYDKLRHQRFGFIKQQYELSEQLQKLDDHYHLIHFNYFYEFGPRCQFNQQLYHLWSEYFDNHPILSKEKSKIILVSKHLHLLNALLAKHK